MFGGEKCTLDSEYITTNHGKRPEGKGYHDLSTLQRTDPLERWSGRGGFPRAMMLEQTPAEGVKRKGNKI